MSTVDNKPASRATFNQLNRVENQGEAKAYTEAPDQAAADATQTNKGTVSKDTLLQHASAIGGSTAEQLEQLINNAGMGDEIDETEMDALFDQALAANPTAATPTENAYNLPEGKVLKNGATGEAVTELQTALGQVMGPDGKPYFEFNGETQQGPTGNFKDVTEAAVRKFQEDHGLTVDGKVGPKTAAAINAAIAAQKAVEEAGPGTPAPVEPHPEDEITTQSVPLTAEEIADFEQKVDDAQSGWGDNDVDRAALGELAASLPEGDPRRAALEPIANGTITGEAAKQILYALKDNDYTRGDINRAAQESQGNPEVLKALAAVAAYKVSSNDNPSAKQEMALLSTALGQMAGASQAVREQLAKGFDNAGNKTDFENAIAAAQTPADLAAIEAWYNHNAAIDKHSFPDRNAALALLADLRLRV